MRVKAYLPFVSAGIQSQLVYKWNFLGFFVGEIFFTFVMYYLWKAVFLHTETGIINGFTIIDMTVYIFVSNITQFLTGTDASYSIGEEIVEGSVSMRMIKPVSYDISLLFTEIGSKVVLLVLILIPVFTGIEVFRFVQTGVVSFSVIRLCVYLVSAALSYLILFYCDLCFGFLAFVLKNLWGFNLLKASIVRFLSGGMIPLVFFPAWALGVLQFFPFASMCYTPIMIYTGSWRFSQIFCALSLQVFWIFVFWAFSRIIWHLTVKRLTVQGG